jgi:hypothetical protein
MTLSKYLILGALNGIALASPAPPNNQHPVNVAVDAVITPCPSINEPTKTLAARADILSKITGEVNSVLSALGSGIPSYVASGMLATRGRLCWVEFGN